jgi:hypothetical protein
MPPYTTELNPLDEMKFQKWIKDNNIKDLNEPDSYYDYRGFWKQNPDFKHSLGQHFPDTFKQPGHPTFSNESQYANTQNTGGRWADNDVYIPQLATSRQSVDPTQLQHSTIYLLSKMLGLEE